MSDKRPLDWYGDGKGYLNETGSVSVRPPGLHIRRAEVWTRGCKSFSVQRIIEAGNVLSMIESQGLWVEKKDFGRD